jgi:hypothetical protein
MLKLKPNCESCNKDLPYDSNQAMICSFECTFCHECVTNEFNKICPNCGGNFQFRPIRPQVLIEKYPALKNNSDF